MGTIDRSSNFVHLHLHTHYSLLDGFTKPAALVKRVKELGMPAVAVTDHGNMHAVVEFYQAAISAGVKPILGLEAYVAPGDRTDRTRDAGAFGEASFHLVLLAETIQGYRNLLKLTSESYRTGFYYKPRIDKKLLAEHADGLIGLSGHLGTEVAAYLERGDMDGARRAAIELRDILGPQNYFLELQDHGDPIQRELIPRVVQLAQEIGVGLVANNDAHFLMPEDHAAHDILLCISTGKTLDDPHRLRYSPELYVKSPQQMRELFAAWPQACDNTMAIADRCNVTLNLEDKYPPAFKLPAKAMSDGQTPDEYLRTLCDEGVRWRYGFERGQVAASALPPAGAQGPEAVTPRAVFERLDRELGVISAKKFSEYFLIVHDFVNWARQQNIPAGARGSGVGTMVGFVLGLSHACPLTYGLLFERFMDPSRSDYPDIDVDMCQDGRERVIEYVRQKYTHVSQIVTFMTLGAKAAIKDVCRVLNLPPSAGNLLSELVPNLPKMTLERALASNPDFAACAVGKAPPELAAKAMQTGWDIGMAPKIIALAKGIEGLARNPGIHAAGVVVADKPLDQFVPLMVMERKDGGDKVRTLVTQVDGPTVEKCGLLKMDFLGLKTLSVIELTRQLVARTTGTELALDKIDLADQDVLAVFRRGQTQGFFQFESGGMQDVLMKMKPDRIEDLIAANALYRPGPMELIPTYCARKHGEPFQCAHPIIAKVCSNTYGIMVYQEQVMQIFYELGGIELGKAYKLIKAISKKKQAEIDAMRPKFIEGAIKNGLSEAQAQEVFEQILKFAGYGFNKSHSAGYAIVAYQTAYLKTYYPAQFMAATLTYESREGKTEAVAPYIEEARKMGLPVLPPDVNSSVDEFTVVPLETALRDPHTDRADKGKPADGVDKGKPADGLGRSRRGEAIRFGLRAIKGVGASAIEEIIVARKRDGAFKDIFDFAERVDLTKVNGGCIESLIKAGAFDSLGLARGVLFENREKIAQAGQRQAQDRRSGQTNMFDMFAACSPKQSTPEVLRGSEWTESQMLKHEKEVLNLYVTRHPLTQHEVLLKRYATHTLQQVADLPEGSEVIVGGVVLRLKEALTKTGRSAGKKMAIVGIEDLTGSIDATAFAETYEQYRELLTLDRVIFVQGEVDRRRENAGLRVNRVIGIEQADEELCAELRVNIVSDAFDLRVLEQVRTLLDQHRPLPPSKDGDRSNRGGFGRRREPQRQGAEVFLSVKLRDRQTPRRVLLKCGSMVRPSQSLAADLERLGQIRCELRPAFRPVIATPAPGAVAQRPRLAPKAADYDDESAYEAIHRWG